MGMVWAALAYIFSGLIVALWIYTKAPSVTDDED